MSLVVMKSLRELGNAQARGDVQPLVARALEEVVIVDAQPDQLPGRQRVLRAARRGWKRCRTAKQKEMLNVDVSQILKLGLC